MAVCLWRMDAKTYEYWEAMCGLAWVFDSGTPTENQMAYCPKCGRKLVVVGDDVAEPEDVEEIEEIEFSGDYYSIDDPRYTHDYGDDDV